MTSPISNNIPAHVTHAKGNRPEDKGQGQGRGQEAEAAAATGQRDDSVTVSRAAQVLSEQPSERGQGSIQSAEQAAEVARGIKAMFEGNSGQALAAQAKNVSSELMDLLKAG